MMRPLLIAMLIGLAPPAMAGDEPAATRGLYLQLIRQARADGKPRAALAYLDDFERQYPADPDAPILRINSLLDLDQIDGAEAVPLPPETREGAVSAVRGHLLAARDRWGEAVPLYQAAMRASPADPLLRNALGYALLRAGQTAQAIETLRGAADLAPGSDVIRNNLLLALAAGGRAAEAEAMLRQIGDTRARDALRRTLATQTALLGPKGR